MLDEDHWGLTSLSLCPPLFLVRSQLGVCTLGGKIYAVGGTSTWSCVNSVEVYDPDLNEWTAAPSMKTNRRAAGVCVHNGKIPNHKGRLVENGGSRFVHSL